MGVAESTYYSDPKISLAEREEYDANVRARVEALRMMYPRAGYRMLLAHLKRDGLEIGERKLRRILTKFKLYIKPKKRFIATTDSKHSHPVYENLIKGKTLDGINQVWAADITYIRIVNGFIFLAVILDLYSRKVIGWSLSKKIDRHLTLFALEMAIERRKPQPGVIHHSDRGVQYLCDDYIEKLKSEKFKISCSRKGNPYDNAFVESFMKTLKNEEVHMWDYETYIEVLDRLPHFIEEIYNKKRLHSSLNYLPPEEFEKILLDYENGKDTNETVSQPILQL